MTQAYRTKGFVSPDEELPVKKKPKTVRIPVFNFYKMWAFTSWAAGTAFFAWLLTLLFCVLGSSSKDIEYCYVKNHSASIVSDSNRFFLIGAKSWAIDADLAGPFGSIEEAKKHAEFIGCSMKVK